MSNAQNPDPYTDEINLLDYLKVINKHRWLILIIFIVAVTATAVISLIMTPIYEAKAVITPATQQKEISPMAGLAAQFGIATPASSSATEIISLLNSNILREKLLKNYNLLPLFFEKGSLDDKTENEKIWKGLDYLKGALKVNFKQKENIIELSMQFKEPQKTAEIINYALTELTDHMSSEAKRVADTNRKSLEALLTTTADPLIKAKIYNMIAQQIEQSAMSEVKENFAFKVLDPPRAPDKRIKPKRRQMVMLSAVTSIFAGIFIAFFKEYIDKARKA